MSSHSDQLAALMTPSQMAAELARAVSEKQSLAVEVEILRTRELGRRANGGDLPVTRDDFYAYMPTHSYLYIPTRDMWPATSVNARLPMTDDMKPSAWLDTYRPVEQMTWAPGEDLLIEDRLISGGGWIYKKGCACFNLYLPPQVEEGDPEDVEPWLDHLCKIYGDHAGHIVNWLAHRVQFPGQKINHALVLGGPQGVGKDTLLEPVKYAIGPWNFQEVVPKQVMGRFNSFVKSVILRVSEARDLGDVDRYDFYDHMKTLTAGPPDVLRCDEKNLREHSVPNVCGVIITTNHKADGIYLPADDRRHFVAWTERTKDDFGTNYWNDHWGWYRQGGIRNVAAFLKSRDLSGFDPKAPPPKTEAWHDIVDSNRAPEDADLADCLEAMGNPDAVTIEGLIETAKWKADDGLFSQWLQDRKNRRQIPYRMETAGYVPVRNDTAQDGLFKFSGRRQVIYAKAGLTLRDRIRAAQLLIAPGK